MDIQDLHIFARVAAVQNLSAVGVELGLTPGTISKRIQSIEDSLSARLFDRTTRSIRITDEGEIFLAHASRILSEMEQVRALVADKVGKAKGRLKVTAPVSFGNAHVVPALLAFLEAFPEIDVQLDLTDRMLNLQDDGYDLAVRVGVLPDSSVIAKRLATDRQIVVASESYIQRHGRPEHPDDLARHSCLVIGDTWQWAFHKGGDDMTVRVAGRFRSDTHEAVVAAARAGHGIARVSEFGVRELLAKHDLVPVLQDYTVAGNWGLWALYPSSRHVMPRLRVLLDFLADWFRCSGRDARSGGERLTPDRIFADRVPKVAAG